LLIHLPGYGAETSSHPQLVAEGFNVLHINPRGYCTPEGLDIEKKRNDCFPVLPDQVETFGEHGYNDWFTDVLVAIRWGLSQSCVQKDRLGTFGTSQGGGTALLLASILCDQIKAIAADVPFLINFPLVKTLADKGAYFLALDALDRVEKSQPQRLAEAWHALGFADVMCHAHRLTMPVLMLAGGADNVCPSVSIESLFAMLKGSRSYTCIVGQDHTYTVPFLPMARGWFGLFV
jgi:cephalosporin-C deacetylase-like acetyl esterase